MDKVIQEAVQVFCQICSRGVIVRNESMFKCKACGREVCRACFSREERLCIECAGDSRPQDLRRAAPPGRRDEGRPREFPEEPRRTRRDVWLVIAGMLLFTAGIGTSLLPMVPFWAGLAAAGAGVIMLAKGLIGLLKA